MVKSLCTEAARAAPSVRQSGRSLVHIATIVLGLLVGLDSGLLVGLSGDPSLACAAAGGPSWLDVRDVGASGSDFEAQAATVAGSPQITVADVGDFRVGQDVMVSKGNRRFTPIQLWGTGEPYRNAKAAEDAVELRGYDGSAGSWAVFVLDIAPASQPAFRWTADLGRTWHDPVPITHGWQSLAHGVEVKLNPRDWQAGYVVAFGVRDQLVSRIEKIEGHVLTLADPANQTAADAIVRHDDTPALQAAIDQALKQRRNVYVSPGHYRLVRSVRIAKPDGLTIAGAGASRTVLDISDGEGACLSVFEGTEVTVRDVRMVGFMGFDERDRAGALNTRGAAAIWGQALKSCNAISIYGTQRALVENCHASRMSSECFVGASPSRTGARGGQSYSQSITYLRCSATDCARNAFNDVLCGAENTAVLQCRIVDVGGCAWEGASRFVKFVGNYVRNAGTVAMGNLGPANRDATYPELGAGQHLVADNVFEQTVPYGGCAIRSARGATQVIIRNNLFVNFGSSAIEASGYSGPRDYPPGNTLIAGNMIDMTCVEASSSPRIAVDISADDTHIGDNQIYVRGAVAAEVTAIRLCEPAVNVNVHDNLIRNCGLGLVTTRGRSGVLEVVDDRTFVRAAWPTGLPLARIQPQLCQGWGLAWLDGNDRPAGAVSVIESFDPQTLRFRLSAPRPMQAGDRFDVLVPALNWTIHDNIITGCGRPLVLDSYGSETSVVRANVITRDAATGVQTAVEIRGRFDLIGNRISGFDEDGAAALALWPGRLGEPCASVYRDNIIQRCSTALRENVPGLWSAAVTDGNSFIDCGAAPTTAP